MYKTRHDASGLSSPTQSRGVTPVYLRCSQGRITWTYPRGALRVLLRLPTAGREFKGCIKVTPEFAGARIFVEGQRLLLPLFSLNDGGHKQLVRCFQSRKGQVALYVEAVDDRGGFRKEAAGFDYDLHPVPKGANILDLISSECRPCGEEEMARAFCSSDIVARGTIDSIDDKQDLELAQINFKVTKLLRESSGGGDDNELVPGTTSKGDVVPINMPRHCAPQHGPGEFVFMARQRLGEMTLVCVPSLSEWVRVVRTMNADGTSHCVLRSS